MSVGDSWVHVDKKSGSASGGQITVNSSTNDAEAFQRKTLLTPIMPGTLTEKPGIMPFSGSKSHFFTIIFRKINYCCYICSVKEIGDVDVSYLYFDMPESGCRK